MTDYQSDQLSWIYEKFWFWSTRSTDLNEAFAINFTGDAVMG